MTLSFFESKLSSASQDDRALHLLVEEYIKQLILEQRWKPGDMLPSEQRLSKEFGVSQGTIRKALNNLADTNVIYRKQGVGTFLSEQTGQALYRFFPIIRDGKPPELPKAEITGLELVKPTPDVVRQLELSVSEKVIKLSRLRTIGSTYILSEVIHLPDKYFPGFMQEQDIPHTLYHFYQTRFNHTVHDTTDRIKAVLATQMDAQQLDIRVGEPILLFTRLTRSKDGKLLEYRINRCRSDNYHYLTEQD